MIRLLTLLMAVLPLAASGASYVWDGNSPGGTGSSRWSRSFNWTAPNAEPPDNNVSGLTNYDITFSGSLKTTPLMDNPYYIRSLLFASNAAAFTLTSRGGEILTIGAGGIVNNSANTQTIFSGLTANNSQTWSANGAAMVIGGTVNLGANALTIGGSKAVSMTNVVLGTGSVSKQGTGTLTLAGASANTYSGGTILNGGTIVVAKANALGSGALTVNSGTLNLGSYTQTVGTVTMTGGTIDGTTATLNASGYQIQSGTLNARLGGTGSLVKSGAGISLLTAANGFTGGTMVNGGTLAVNNPSGSGTGSGTVSVNNGGTLVGTGNIGGTLTNRFGGTISAGFEVGQLNTATQFWLGGSTNRWDLSDATAGPGVGWDLLNISGTLNIAATATNKTTLNIVSFTLGGVPGAAANFDPSQSYLWKIAQTTGGITFAPGEDESSVFDLMTSGFLNPFNGGIFDITTANGGRELNLTFTPAVIVPEPSTLAFAALCLCGYVYGRRWKRHWGR